MLSVSVRLESSARSFIKPSPEDDIFNSNGGGPGPGRTVAVSALCPDPWHLLFPDPHADEKAAEEGGRVPTGAQSGGPDRHHERDLRADHQTERKVGASTDRRQGKDR